ncbi:MAG: hypothetical protein NVSMB32_12600 [Actinomycetota bacterium]
MGLDDKVEAKVDQAKGTVERKAGEATGDRDMELTGAKDQAKGKVKEGVEDIKDAIKH